RRDTPGPLGLLHAVCLLAALLMASAAGVAGAAVEVPLVMVWPEQVRATSWPVRLGVPFARGALRDAQGLTVLDARGKPAAGVQIDTAATWPDGSVRWLHVVLVAERDASYRLTEGSGRADAVRLSLERRDDGAIAIDTGAARYDFRP